MYPSFASGAELTNIVVKNSHGNLLVNLTINGVFTDEMKAALLKGVPISFSFLVILYEANPFWFDKKIAKVKTIHKIKYDSLKNDYTIIRSWDKTGPLVVKNFEKARILISEIDSLKIISFSTLEKGKHYQLRVKSELVEKKFPFSRFPWEFETDWYTINFIY
jgi:hypothetical protein